MRLLSRACLSLLLSPPCGDFCPHSAQVCTDTAVCGTPPLAGPIDQTSSVSTQGHSHGIITVLKQHRLYSSGSKFPNQGVARLCVPPAASRGSPSFAFSCCHRALNSLVYGPYIHLQNQCSIFSTLHLSASLSPAPLCQLWLTALTLPPTLSLSYIQLNIP